MMNTLDQRPERAVAPPIYQRTPSINSATLAREASADLNETVARRSSPEDVLDSTGHRVRGGGILCSKKDVNMNPDDFALGCKLLQATARDDPECVSAMLRSQPHYVNFRDYDRRTALHVAASEGHLDVVRLLVQLGARVNRSDRWGGSPLDDAHRHHHKEVAAFLRSKGGTTGSADRTSNLIAAAAGGDLDEVRMLLSYEPGGGPAAGANSKGGKGAAVAASTTSLDINAGDYDKRTALHLAAGEGHFDIVKLLCKAGANVNAEDRWGGRPLDDARQRDFGGCVAVLERHGARGGKEGQRTEHVLNISSSRSTNMGSNRIQDESGDVEANLRVDFSELEMIDNIGSGAFGEIYKARWRGTLVAAKCIKSAKIVKEWRDDHPLTPSERPEKLPKEDSSSISATERKMALHDFRQETIILRKLRHPNICMLLAYSITEDFEVMISELMKCSLLDVLRANALNNTLMPKRKKIIYAQQLAQGMHYLHTCRPPIIHRDLKPANLLIDFSGTLKIADFGLAKIRPDPKKTEMEMFIMTGETGSYRFMAPEVFRHEDYTETIDVYSYAMILFYLLRGLPPWAGLNGLMAVQKAAMDGDRPIVPRDWDHRLSNLLGRCWDENPKARPSFERILGDLNDYSRDVLKQNIDMVAMADERGCNCNIM